jgi:hypothetical protein
MAKASELKVGDVVKMANSRFAGYGYSKGDIVNITYKNGSSLNIQKEGCSSISVTAADLEISHQTKGEIQAEIKRIEEALKVRKDRLKWMEETKSELYNEEEFKVWQILSTMDSKSSKIDKARAIAAIIKK